jgi:hypothetical protein
MPSKHHKKHKKDHHAATDHHAAKNHNNAAVVRAAAAVAATQALVDRAKVDVKDGTCKLMNDTVAKTVESIWKTAFPSASILPVIGMPSTGNGVMTLIHGMDLGDSKIPMPLLKINGLISKSALANNALYSVECSGGGGGNPSVYLNLYEIMLPDIPGTNGAKSTAQIYINELAKAGLDVTAAHYHWTGAGVFPNDKGVTAVHHMGIDIDPIDFSDRTIAALRVAMAEIMRRAQ